MVDVPNSPIGLRITAINMFKNRHQEKLNILPQFYELNIYQSVFRSCMKAEMVIVDPIGLFYNYPLVGEETIEVEFEPTRDTQQNLMEVSRWVFMINSVREATPMDTIRGQVYILELYSLEMRANAKERVQKAYYDSYDKIIQSIIEDQNYLRGDPRKLQFRERLFEKSDGKHHIVVPNMKPLEAISWLASRAVSVSFQDRFTYFFFETFYGWNFLTYEKMVFEPWLLDAMNPAAREEIPKYAYISNVPPAMVDQIKKSMGVPEHNLITGMQIQKRWNTIEKTMSGYFENEYLEIDMWNKTIKSTKTKLDAAPNMKVKDGQVFNMNSQLFIEDMQHQSSLPDTATRVKYVTSQSGGDQFDDPQGWERRWGNATQNLAGLSQVVVTASAPGDTRINSGDIIEVFLPEVHGFSELQKDAHLAGVYFITDVKHTITTGQQHVMVLNMSRNSYNESLTGQNKMTKPMKYKV